MTANRDACPTCGDNFHGASWICPDRWHDERDEAGDHVGSESATPDGRGGGEEEQKPTGQAATVTRCEVGNLARQPSFANDDKYGAFRAPKTYARDEAGKAGDDKRPTGDGRLGVMGVNTASSGLSRQPSESRKSLKERVEREMREKAWHQDAKNDDEDLILVFADAVEVAVRMVEASEKYKLLEIQRKNEAIERAEAAEKAWAAVSYEAAELEKARDRNAELWDEMRKERDEAVKALADETAARQLADRHRSKAGDAGRIIRWDGRCAPEGGGDK